MQRLERVSTAQLIEDDYFSVNPAPPTCQVHSDAAAAFIEHHAHAGRRVVLVTSGGTTVPLENQTVRFIDNFSAGTRGATSAEFFLEAGYAVVFLHRQFSLLPYSRHYSHSSNCFLDFMAEDERGGLMVREGFQDRMRLVLRKYAEVQRNGTLLVLPFTTITEYLWTLRAIAYSLQPLGPCAIFYLAAAVSDFFVPKDRLAEHKIQSSVVNHVEPADGTPPTSHSSGKKLVIDLDPVPKFLKRLVDGWAPDAMIVSFKLETDPDILVSKARTALERYSHHLVIGNLLATRSWEVVFVAPDGREKWIRIPLQQRRKGSVAGAAGPSGAHVPSPVEIESIIVPEVIVLHDKHIANGPRVPVTG